MHQRFFIHLSLVLLFAFTQMGITTHAISHFDAHQQHNQDQNVADDQCGQCIAYEQSANAVAAPLLVIPTAEGVFHFTTITTARLTALLTPTYSARAPPTFSIS